VPYLADWGYFITQDAFDLCGVPGQAQTFIVSAALCCTSLVVIEEYDVPAWERAVTLAVPALLFGAAVAVRSAHALGWGPRVGSKDHAQGSQPMPQSAAIGPAPAAAATGQLA